MIVTLAAVTGAWSSMAYFFDPSQGTEILGGTLKSPVSEPLLLLIVVAFYEAYKLD